MEVDLDGLWQLWRSGLETVPEEQGTSEVLARFRRLQKMAQTGFPV
jgi:hypothetical protein